MRIAIDATACQGHGRCYALLPGLVDLDDYGLATVVGAGEVPAELEANARLAEANCPEFAFSVIDAGGGE